MSDKIRVRAGGRTDVGRVRGQNEDRVLLAPDLGLFLVADGMGGHATGQVASAMVAASMHNFFLATVGERFAPDVPEDDGLDASSLRLVHAVRKANRDIFEASSQHPEHKGMGSTVVALHVEGASVTLAHVGDSRCYRIRNGALERLTSDHSLVGEALRHKPDISAADLALLPNNVITRALGMRATVKVDAQRLRLEAGDMLLICSDGLHGMLDDAAIAHASKLHDNLDEACELLVALANDAGGTDNVSVVLVGVAEEQDEVSVESTEVPVDEELERLLRDELADPSVPRCGACGTQLIAGNAFCNECGTRVA
ncbi:MAG: protein phosphatase 2C domain-containing protein [Polyangiales bacterium]